MRDRDLSSPRVVLHIGSPKSGTTYLQDRLFRNADALDEGGVLVPVLSDGEGSRTLPFRAALDLTSRRMGRPEAFVAGYWSRLVDVVAAASGDVVVSHEAFVRCDLDQAARAVEELGARGEVHVVVTARELSRSLLSAWLEGLKHGTTRDLDDHFALARAGTLPVLRAFDLPDLLGRWQAVLPPGRLHLVTVPTSGRPGELWERFCAAAGLDPALAPVDGRRRNDAVGLAEAQVLLALNRLLGAEVSRGTTIHRAVQQTVVPALAESSSGSVRLGSDDLGWARDSAERVLSWLADSGVHVTGDLADLVPDDVAASGPGARSCLPPSAAADAAALALRALLEAVSDLEATSAAPVARRRGPRWLGRVRPGWP